MWLFKIVRFGRIKSTFCFYMLLAALYGGERGGEKNLKIQNVEMCFDVRKVQLNLFKNVLRDVCFKGII